jgi:predicted Zn-dependent protease
VIAAHEVVERALAYGRRGDELAVILDDTTHTHLRWAGATVTRAAHVLSRRIHVVVIAPDHTAGVVSASGALDAGALRDLVDDASAAARRADAETVAPLPPPDRPAASDWTEPAGTAPPGVLAQLAAEAADGAHRFGASGRALHGYAEHEVRTTLLGTSTGARLRHVQPTAVVDLTARAAAAPVSAWTGIELSDITELDLPDLLGSLEQRLDWGRRRVTVRPGRHEVLLPRSGTADLMRQLYWSAGAQDAEDGRSAFSAPSGGTRLGERFGVLPLTLRSDPGEKDLTCDPFVVVRTSGADTSVGDNGLTLGPTPWITDGVLTALVHTRASARRAGAPVTPRVGNLVLEGASSGPSLDEMVASTAQGLLLTSLWYLREVDPRTLLLTGLTRDGVYLVRDGEVVGAVDDFRFNESPLDLLGRTTEVGLTAPTLAREWDDQRTRTAMPPLRIGDFAAFPVETPA